MRRATFAVHPATGPQRHGHVVRTVGAAVVAALAAIATCATLAGCADPVVGPGPLPTGPWGGMQGNLVVYADSVTLDLPCAEARIPTPLVTDGEGRFDLPGQWAIAAGPVFPGGPNWQSARFTGQRTGDLLRLTVQVNAGATVGPLDFRRGVIGDFPRCM